MALLETLMVLPRISTLKLDRNSLTVTIILFRTRQLPTYATTSRKGIETS